MKTISVLGGPRPLACEMEAQMRTFAVSWGRQGMCNRKLKCHVASATLRYHGTVLPPYITDHVRALCASCISDSMIIQCQLCVS